MNPGRDDERSVAASCGDSAGLDLRAFDALPDAILVVGVDGSVLHANSAAESLFGRRAGDLVGCVVEDLIPARLREAHTRAREGWGETPDVRPMSARQGLHALRADGAEIPVDISLATIAGAAGPVVIAVVRDATQSARAEHALRLSEERYRSFFESTPSGACITRPDGGIVVCNARFHRMFRIAGAEEAARTSAGTLYADPADRTAVLDELTRTGTVVGRELEFRRADGSTFRGVLSSVAVRDAEGNLVEIQSHVLDVSAVRSLEAQLLQSQKLEALGRLAGGVAHDFNNLLTAMSGYAELILRTLERTDPRHAWCAEVLATTERAASLTSQLLAFSRKQVIRPTVLDVGAVMTALARMLHRIVGEDVRLETEVAAATCRVRADRTQIEQILLNLAVNAREAMPDGGTLRIAVGRVPPANGAGEGWVEIVVSDTGVGMAPEVQARVFEPFFTTKEMGTGLGLSTVYGVVEQAGGTIAVQSAPGCGTEFRIRLPEVAEPQPSPTPAPAEAGDPPSGRGLVLLVEDDPRVLNLARRVLEAYGYTVETAPNGREGLARIAAGIAPDLVVTDVVMPEMGGREMTDAARARLPGLRVIFMSGYAEDSMLRARLVDGADPFLSKPFTPSQLARKVAEVLRGRDADQNS